MSIPLGRVTIEGGPEILKALKGFEAKVSRRVVRDALTAGARIIQTGARANAPRKTGALMQSIHIKPKSTSRGVKVDVGVGKKWFVGDQFYGAFQEFGWKAGKRKKGASRKQIPGEHYVEFAYDELKDRALAVVVKAATAGIGRERTRITIKTERAKAKRLRAAKRLYKALQK